VGAGRMLSTLIESGAFSMKGINLLLVLSSTIFSSSIFAKDINIQLSESIKFDGKTEFVSENSAIAEEAGLDEVFLSSDVTLKSYDINGNVTDFGSKQTPRMKLNQTLKAQLAQRCDIKESIFLRGQDVYMTVKGQCQFTKDEYDRAEITASHYAVYEHYKKNGYEDQYQSFKALQARVQMEQNAEVKKIINDRTNQYLAHAFNIDGKEIQYDYANEKITFDIERKLKLLNTKTSSGKLTHFSVDTNQMAEIKELYNSATRLSSFVYLEAANDSVAGANDIGNSQYFSKTTFENFDCELTKSSTVICKFKSSFEYGFKTPNAPLN
jgi:hypothetical protein